MSPSLCRAAQVVYRRYASLFLLAGVDRDENALAVLEMIHAYVEALDRYFGAVCELDIMFHLDKVCPARAVYARFTDLLRARDVLRLACRHTSFWTKW